MDPMMVDVLSRSLTSFVDHTLIVATPKLIVKNVKSVVPIPVANIAWKFQTTSQENALT